MLKGTCSAWDRGRPRRKCTTVVNTSTTRCNSLPAVTISARNVFIPQCNDSTSCRVYGITRFVRRGIDEDDELSVVLVVLVVLSSFERDETKNEMLHNKKTDMLIFS